MTHIEKTRLAIYRASGAPMNWKCPGSARTATLRIDEDNDAAALGTAAHVALAKLSETNVTPWDALPDIAKHHGVNETELRVLVAQGTKLWNEVSASFVGAMSEVSLMAEIAPGVQLTGHVDLFALSARSARAGDWKTGRKDGDYSQQMHSYAALIILDNPEIDEVTVTVLWVRESEIENYTSSRAQVLQWVAEYVARVVRWDGVYHPGSHCQWCARSHECDAANAMGRRDVALIADKSLVYRAETELSTMPDEEIVDLAEKVDFVRKCADRVWKALSDQVKQRGSVVANGQALVISERETKELDTLKAWPILEAAGFSDEEFQQCVSVSLSKVNSIVATRAGKGKGAAAVRELRSALDAVSAITIKAKQFLARKRA